MKTLMAVCVLLLASGSAFSEEKTLSVEVYGARTVMGHTMPLYSIALNSPYQWEKGGLLERVIGPFAVDGFVFVRHPAAQHLWYKTFWRKPKTIEEFSLLRGELVTSEGNFKKTSFYEESPADPPAKVLPPPFNSLPTAEVEKIFSIILYQDGSMRIFMEGGIDQERTVEMLKFFSEQYDIRTPEIR